MPNEEQEEKEAGEVAALDNTDQEGGCGSGALGTTPLCVPCDGNVCYCKDKQQVTYFVRDEEEEEVW